MRNVKQIRPKLLYIFYYIEFPYNVTVFHKQEVIDPRKCKAYKQLVYMLRNNRNIFSIGYTTQYENEIL